MCVYCMRALACLLILRLLFHLFLSLYSWVRSIEPGASIHRKGFLHAQLERWTRRSPFFLFPADELSQVSIVGGPYPSRGKCCQPHTQTHTHLPTRRNLLPPSISRSHFHPFVRGLIFAAEVKKNDFFDSIYSRHDRNRLL